MPNEREIKLGIKTAGPRPSAVCSITGRDCCCESGDSCSDRIVSRLLERDKEEARRWILTAAGRIQIPINDLKLAIEALPSDRAFPTPELHQATRSLRRVSDDLNQILKAFQ